RTRAGVEGQCRAEALFKTDLVELTTRASTAEAAERLRSAAIELLVDEQNRLAREIFAPPSQHFSVRPATRLESTSSSRSQRPDLANLAVFGAVVGLGLASLLSWA